MVRFEIHPGRKDFVIPTPKYIRSEPIGHSYIRIYRSVRRIQRNSEKSEKDLESFRTGDRRIRMECPVGISSYRAEFTGSIDIGNERVCRWNVEEIAFYIR